MVANAFATASINTFVAPNEAIIASINTFIASNDTFYQQIVPFDAIFIRYGAVKGSIGAIHVPFGAINHLEGTVFGVKLNVWEWKLGYKLVKKEIDVRYFDYFIGHTR